MTSLRLALKMSMGETVNPFSSKSTDDEQKEKKEKSAPSKRKRADSEVSMSSKDESVDGIALVERSKHKAKPGPSKKRTTSSGDLQHSKSSSSIQSGDVDDDDESHIVNGEEKMKDDNDSTELTSSSSSSSSSSSKPKNRSDNKKNRVVSSSKKEKGPIIKSESDDNTMDVATVDVGDDAEENKVNGDSVGDDVKDGDNNKLDESVVVKTAQKKRRRPSATMGLDEIDIVDLENRDEDSPRYQSNRAAAMLAKTKLSSKGPRLPGDRRIPEDIDKGESESKQANNGDEDATPAPKQKREPKVAAPALEWVACDLCGKWRSLPPSINIDSLPEQWYCSMNEWDSVHNTCEAPEATGDTSAGKDDADEEDQEGNITIGGRGRKASSTSKPRGKPKSNSTSNNGDADDERGEGEDNSDNETHQAPVIVKKRPGPKAGANRPPVVEKVNWVQCNKCSKWRKVPGSIDVDSLPEVWLCSLNTWAPMMARCTAKEESEPTFEEDDDDEKATTSTSRGGYRRGPSSAGNRDKSDKDTSILTSPMHASANGNNGIVGASGTGTGAVKKVTQWVQCERRNCKKWRKLPGHVDMSQLPEKWFCEMNRWDIDRASCDGPEETDSEGEQQPTTGSRSQLILANSKGPGALSYRRIIFGTDGRIRPSYSEKNKNGYGLFSYSETQRPTDAEDYVEPTRRMSYWWSSVYDESGALYVSSNKKHPSAHSSMMKREAKDKEKEKEKEDSTDTSKDPNNSSAVSQKITPFPVSEPTALLDAARRFGIGNIEPTLPPFSCNPKERFKFGKVHSSILTLEKIRIECAIVRSCLLSSHSASLTLPGLLSIIKTAQFSNIEEEVCRRSICLDSLKAAVRRLELSGEAEITLTAAGEVMVHGLTPLSLKSDSLTTTMWSQRGLPLRMRKSIGKLADARKLQKDSDIAEAAEIAAIAAAAAALELAAAAPQKSKTANSGRGTPAVKQIRPKDEGDEQNIQEDVNELNKATDEEEEEAATTVPLSSMSKSSSNEEIDKESDNFSLIESKEIDKEDNAMSVDDEEPPTTADMQGKSSEEKEIEIQL